MRWRPLRGLSELYLGRVHRRSLATTRGILTALRPSLVDDYPKPATATSPMQCRILPKQQVNCLDDIEFSLDRSWQQCQSINMLRNDRMEMPAVEGGNFASVQSLGECDYR